MTGSSVYKFKIMLLLIVPIVVVILLNSTVIMTNMSYFGHGISYNLTTCGINAWNRGTGQKVIGFSLYGNNDSKESKLKGYVEGIAANLKLMGRYYPGWIMRLYYDLSRDDPVMNDLYQLIRQYDNFDICYIRDLPGIPLRNASHVHALMWRFFPTLDPQVDVFVSRDLDSRFSDRETSAVNEWLRSGKPIHSMRDHPYHTVSYLGGGWGSDMRINDMRSKWKITWTNILNDNATYSSRMIKGPDQNILGRHLWPWGKGLTLQHDSYLCHYYPGSIGWPTERNKKPNNFFGSIVNLNKTLWKICPPKCRRKLEWEYC